MMLAELHDLDQPNAHWIIPRMRTKNKKVEHTVPLSPIAVQLIREGLEASREGWEGKNDRPVFAGRFEGVTSLARNQISLRIPNTSRVLLASNVSVGRPSTSRVNTREKTAIKDRPSLRYTAREYLGPKPSRPPRASAAAHKPFAKTTASQTGAI
jgi:hypothetical protein